MQGVAEILERAPLADAEAVSLAAALAAEISRQARSARRPMLIAPEQLVANRLADGSMMVRVRSGILPGPLTARPDDDERAAAAYELGALVFRAMTGQPPPGGDASAALAGGGLRARLAPLVLGLLAQDPARRLPLAEAAEKLAALARDAQREPVAEAPVPVMPVMPVPVMPVAGVPAVPVVAAPGGDPLDPEQRFFAEGDHLSARLQAEVAQAGPDDEMVPADGDTLIMRRRASRTRVLIGLAAAGVLAAIGGSWWSLSAGGDDEQAVAAGGREPIAAPEPEVEPEPAVVPEPEPAAPAPEPVAAEPATEPEPEPAAAPTVEPTAAPEPATEPAPEPAAVPEPTEPEPASEPEPEPAGEPAPAATVEKSRSADRRRDRASRTRAARRARTAAARAEPDTPRSSADWLVRARTYRSKKRTSDAYRAYSNAASHGNRREAAAGELGMAEMAYAMRKYQDTVSHARKALALGAPPKRSWRVMAEGYCGMGYARAAWDAYTRAGGGNCK